MVIGCEQQKLKRVQTNVILGLYLREKQRG